jgi:hypothetical protein
LKNRKKTEEEDEFNGLGRKRMGGRRNKSKKPRKRLFQITGGTPPTDIPSRIICSEQVQACPLS